VARRARGDRYREETIERREERIIEYR